MGAPWRRSYHQEGARRAGFKPQASFLVPSLGRGDGIEIFEIFEIETLDRMIWNPIPRSFRRCTC